MSTAADYNTIESVWAHYQVAHKAVLNPKEVKNTMPELEKLINLAIELGEIKEAHTSSFHFRQGKYDLQASIDYFGKLINPEYIAEIRWMAVE